MTFTRDIEASRYEVTVNGELAGFSRYARRDDRVVFAHTEVEPELEGRGIGSQLARYALDDVRAQGVGVEARCPFSAYISRHRAYQNLLARPR